MGLAFEWTIKVGDLITLLGGAAVAVGIFYKRGGIDAGVANAIAALTKDFVEMKEEMKALTGVIRDQAVQRTEINLLMKWYDELRRGIGKIDQ